MDKACPKGSLKTKEVLVLLCAFLPKHQSSPSVWLSTSVVLHKPVSLPAPQVKGKQKGGCREGTAGHSLSVLGGWLVCEKIKIHAAHHMDHWLFFRATWTASVNTQVASGCAAKSLWC